MTLSRDILLIFYQIRKLHRNITFLANFWVNQSKPSLSLSLSLDTPTLIRSCIEFRVNRENGNICRIYRYRVVFDVTTVRGVGSLSPDRNKISPASEGGEIGKVNKVSINKKLKLAPGILGKRGWLVKRGTGSESSLVKTCLINIFHARIPRTTSREVRRIYCLDRCTDYYIRISFLGGTISLWNEKKKKKVESKRRTNLERRFAD